MIFQVMLTTVAGLVLTTILLLLVFIKLGCLKIPDGEGLFRKYCITERAILAGKYPAAPLLMRTLLSK